jgi:hypothetical protein
MPPKIKASPYPKLTLIIGANIIGRPGAFYLDPIPAYRDVFEPCSDPPPAIQLGGSFSLLESIILQIAPCFRLK